MICVVEETVLKFSVGAEFHHVRTSVWADTITENINVTSAIQAQTTNRPGIQVAQVFEELAMTIKFLESYAPSTDSEYLWLRLVYYIEVILGIHRDILNLNKLSIAGTRATPL